VVTGSGPSSKVSATLLVPVTDCEPAGPWPVAWFRDAWVVAGGAGLLEVRAGLGDTIAPLGLGDGLGDMDGLRLADGTALVVAMAGATDAFAPGSLWPRQAVRLPVMPKTTTRAAVVAARRRRRTVINRAVGERGGVSRSSAVMRGSGGVGSGSDPDVWSRVGQG
jgi:hypothetical protein